jgi:hypothetical protein
MRFLRTNTAVIITVGPFYDKTDGVTIETALTITNERITLTADTDDGAAPTNILDNVTGATSGTANDLNYITGNDAGLMQLELATANVNRLGRMFLSITDAANHVPVFHEFMVVPALVYDTYFASTGGATFPAATLASTTNITAGALTSVGTLTTYTGNTPQTGDSFARIGETGSGLTSLSTQASVNTIDDFLDTEIAGIVSTLGVAGAGLTDLGGMSATMKAQIETEVDDSIGSGTGVSLTAVPWNAAWDAEVQSEVQDALDAIIADSIPADGTRPSIVQALYMLTQFLTESNVSGTTVTVKKVDGSTTLFTLTINDASNPSTITRAT